MARSAVITEGNVAQSCKYVPVQRDRESAKADLALPEMRAAGPEPELIASPSRFTGANQSSVEAVQPCASALWPFEFLNGCLQQARVP